MSVGQVESQNWDGSDYSFMGNFFFFVQLLILNEGCVLSATALPWLILEDESGLNFNASEAKRSKLTEKFQLITHISCKSIFFFTGFSTLTNFDETVDALLVNQKENRGREQVNIFT